jgi:hypothetical protein
MVIEDDVGHGSDNSLMLELSITAGASLGIFTSV